MSAFVQAVSAQAAATAVTTAGITTTGGNTLVAVIAEFSTNAAAATPVTDSNGNIWTQVHAFVGASTGERVAMYLAKNIIGGAAHTFTFTLTGTGQPSIAVAEISAADTLDKVASGAVASGTAYTSAATATTTQATAIVVGSFTHDTGGSPAITTTAPEIIPTGGSQTGTVNSPIALDYRIVSATAAYSSHFTQAGTAATAALGVASFYQAAVAAPIQRPYEARPRFAALIAR